MAKKDDKTPELKKKVRAEKYEEKVHFEGTLEQMIKLAVSPKKHAPGDELKALKAKKEGI